MSMNHKVDADGLSKDDIDTILSGTSKSMKMEEASTEASLLTFGTRLTLYLVLKLASHETVQSLYEYHISGEADFSASDIGSRVMTKLCLHAINSRPVDAKQQAVVLGVNALVYYTEWCMHMHREK
eukprot:scaffold167459_cov70-Attheya_sp.AAC.8